MHSRQTQPPALVPVLSRGRHRNPNKGACFMEFASYLAGERWSDHPACTHPLLAGLARLVNDYTSDDKRSELVGLIPSVIGLTSDDLHVDAQIALRCARTALPVVAADLQLAMAVSVLAAEQMLAELDGRPPGELSEESAEALALVPRAAEGARKLRRGIRVSARGFRRFAAPNTVQLAARGVAHACVNDPDALLRSMLTEAIADCERLIGRRTAPAAPALVEAR
ncbi:hypothetical protein Misp01_61580 [Microtetraspora sp. NBRC 13810]|uniref:hypothetical protein n=1 Tax=Microtetraspora sp. NBRC 13810 TaxID=3030990 RepID=UPI0024A53FC8|nr:hypothetical protein [Microtetraspora sp. NBRC 13810]GLW11030.1 hypothetical protein Misp01_61580 [Microtetraspora sp. NBRC 13810]